MKVIILYLVLIQIGTLCSANEDLTNIAVAYQDFRLYMARTNPSIFNEPRFWRFMVLMESYLFGKIHLIHNTVCILILCYFFSRIEVYIKFSKIQIVHLKLY